MSAEYIITGAVAAFLTAAAAGSGAGGGGLFTVFLTFAAGVGRFEAQGMNMWTFVFAAAPAAVCNAYKHRVNVRLTAFLSFCGTLGCLLGALIAPKTPPEALKTVFGVFMILTGAKALYGVFEKKTAKEP